MLLSISVNLLPVSLERQKLHRVRRKFIHSLVWADVTLRHAKGKNAENTVYACALLSTHVDTNGTKGEKGAVSRMSDQANVNITQQTLQ